MYRTPPRSRDPSPKPEEKTDIVQDQRASRRLQRLPPEHGLLPETTKKIVVKTTQMAAPVSLVILQQPRDPPTFHEAATEDPESWLETISATVRRAAKAAKFVRNAVPMSTTPTLAIALHCAKCDGEHAAYSGSWPSWKKEKEAVTNKIKENISFEEARRRVSYQPKNTFADVPRLEAATERLPAAVRPTSSESAITPPASAAVAASAAPPPQQKGPSTSWQVASKVSSSVPRPSRPTKRAEECVSSASQEAMDTTTSKMAPPVPTERRGSPDCSKKDETRVTAPPKSL
ncbi:uncharacterized protein [Dermacentor albipictus]|uniref:uncharacterized protein n=1 Tax=Dermacentor albipictus TaxID=60249 RepID=UPI0038FC45B5